MNYFDGKKLMVGDRLKLGGGWVGTVVCSIEDDEYTAEYPREHWAQLKTGVMIMSSPMGLIHYDDTDEDFELMERKTETPGNSE